MLIEEKINGISIIVPCFNSNKTIVKVIESILINTKRINYEVIIIDDGSDDNIKDICCRYSNVKYYWKKNGGVSKARNYGVMKSQYDYIAFLDSDDEWLPHKIDKQIKIIENNNLKFIGSGWSNKKYFYNDQIYKIEENILPIKWWPHISTIVLEKKLFLKVGGFDEEMRYAEDGDFFMKIAKENQLYCTNENLVNTAFQKKSNYNSGLSADLKSMYLGEIKIIKRHVDNIINRNIYIMIIYGKYLIRVCVKSIQMIRKN